jgi:hypothetical protein
LWLHHKLAEGDPAVWPTLALAHAVHRQRQAMTAAIGFDEAGSMDGLGLGWVVIAAHGHTPLIMHDVLRPVHGGQRTAREPGPALHRRPVRVPPPLLIFKATMHLMPAGAPRDNTVDKPCRRWSQSTFFDSRNRRKYHDRPVFLADRKR